MYHTGIASSRTCRLQSHLDLSQFQGEDISGGFIAYTLSLNPRPFVCQLAKGVPHLGVDPKIYTVEETVVSKYVHSTPGLSQIQPGLEFTLPQVVAQRSI